MFIFSKVGIKIFPVPTSQVGSKNQLKGYKRTYKYPVSEVGNVFLNGAEKIPYKQKKSSPLHSSCLGNPMDRGAWRATVHGVTKGQT